MSTTHAWLAKKQQDACTTAVIIYLQVDIAYMGSKLMALILSSCAVRATFKMGCVIDPLINCHAENGINEKAHNSSK